LSDEQIRNLNWYAESDLFSPDEKIVLELADAITATPAKVTPELRQRLQQRFSNDTTGGTGCRHCVGELSRKVE